MPEEQTERCRMQILSEEYADLIVSVDRFEQEVVLDQACMTRVSENRAVLQLPRSRLTADPFSYPQTPRLYGLMDETAMEAAGISRTQLQPALGLRGSGVLIGFLDTGIDYRNPVFLDQAGRTRILRIWDQTDQTGQSPEGFFYGTEYTDREIQESLSGTADMPVPERDEHGHGTFLASLAAGRPVPEQDFSGAAPEAYLAVVKLKEAKQYLRDYYFIKENATAYEETDLMTAVRYLVEVSGQLGLPLVILVGLGTSYGGHTQTGPLEQQLTQVCGRLGTAVVVAAGNETGRGHHYYGGGTAKTEYVELRIPDGERGITMELWADAPESYSLQILSPLGEGTGRIYPQLRETSVFRYLMEGTILYVEAELIERDSGSSVVRIRMETPTPGIWTLAVYGGQTVGQGFHIWLPIEGFCEEETVFLRPAPEVTITMPSTADGPVTFGAYDHRRKSLYLHSGRGYTRNGRVKPDLIAPGVMISGVYPDGQFGTMTGTSAAAAIGAGAAALLLEWGIVRGNEPGMRTWEVKSLMIRGARRNEKASYPNLFTGYGALDVFHIFETVTF